MWLMALLLASTAASAGSDRIFLGGFEPCCRIGGTVSGLSRSGLVLHLHAGDINEDRVLAGNSLYDFAASVPPGTVYSLSVGIQPDGQTCTFVISGGTMGNSDIGNADVICSGNLDWDSSNWGEYWN